MRLTAKCRVCPPLRNVSTSPSQHFTLKLDSSGNVLWIKQVEVDIMAGGDEITMDNAGNLYVAGAAVQMISYDPDGNRRFSSYFNVPDQPDVSGIASDSNGSAYITGQVRDTAAPTYDIFLLKAGGNCQ